nr:MAG TPA: hypothetical protein [Caudoviricetes sp.]
MRWIYTLFQQMNKEFHPKTGKTETNIRHVL